MLVSQKKILKFSSLPATFLEDFPYICNEEEKEQIYRCVEIVDNQGAPFLLMPIEYARKKKLPRRIFLSVLKDTKKRALIVKRRNQNKNDTALWNLSSMGNVMAGESAEGAVLREFQRDFRLDIQANISIEELLVLPFMENETMLSASIFLAGPCRADEIEANAKNIEDFMFLTKDELEGISSKHPEIFHSLLFWALRSGWIF